MGGGVWRRNREEGQGGGMGGGVGRRNGRKGREEG